MTQFLAVIAIIILICLTAFQLALIFGAPLGNYAWGGAHRVLPTSLRIGSISSILIYVLMILIYIDKSGLTKVFDNPSFSHTGMVVMVIYSGLGIGLNAISRSKKERNVMTPVVTILFIISLLLVVMQ